MPEFHELTNASPRGVASVFADGGDADARQQCAGADARNAHAVRLGDDADVSQRGGAEGEDVRAALLKAAGSGFDIAVAVAEQLERDAGFLGGVVDTVDDAAGVPVMSEIAD